jgi:predicted RNA-binding protein YlqC (UPF0109 family)
MAVNYETLIQNLVMPLVLHPDDVGIKLLAENDHEIIVQILVNESDLGRVIGKNGRIANAIRTIAYASAARQNKKITIQIDAY